jgi:hypothetical protein
MHDGIALNSAELNDTPEVRRYALKLESYLTVQKIEREMARNAVDAGINRNIITRPTHDSLGFLAYDETVQFTLESREKLRVDTFFAYGYGAQEIQFTIEIIKKLFKTRGIWRESELVSAIRAPPFGVWLNPALILDSSISIALAFLTSVADNPISIRDRAIIVDGAEHIIAAGYEDDAIIYFLTPIAATSVAGIPRARPIIDIESYLRGSSADREIVVPLVQYESAMIFENDILIKLQRDFAAPHMKKRKVVPFLIDFPSDSQKLVARKFVEDAEFRAKFANLYAFLNSLGIFVHFGYAMKYRDIARRIGEVSGFNATDPIGFTDGASVRIYQPSDGEWITLGRSALNLHTEFEENPIIIGIFRQFPYAIKFQLRAPMQKLRAALRAQTDGRLIERGSVCTTHARPKIEKIARSLGMSSIDIRAHITTGEICEKIQETLVTREIEERARHRSLIKYVYGWWDSIPSII